MPDTPAHADHALDFALLQQTPARQAGRNRIALLWLFGLSLLLVGAVATLLLYLNNFEAEEAARRRAADAQWLEHSVQFHFRRLEDDLLGLAHKAARKPTARTLNAPASAALQGGLLAREAGVLLASGWQTASLSGTGATLPARWQADLAAHAANAQALAVMQATSRGLRRAAYAGPMLGADGQASDVVWLAVPYFDRGEFAGNYLAAIALRSAITALVPDWFAQEHQVRLRPYEASAETDSDTDYRVALNLAGTDLFLQVLLTRAQPATVPRMFFVVALLFLSGMLLALYALRRDFAKRQQVQALLRAQVALRTAMENSVTIGLRAWDRQGRILYVNEAFARMVGYPQQALTGRLPPFPYWPPDQQEALARVHQEIMAKGTAGAGVEVQFMHHDGHLLDVLIHEAPLNSAVGMQLGWMSSVLDISERKRAQRMAAAQQERLEASGRLVAMGEVASTLAHELNQPLGALSSFANGLLNRLNDQSISLAELLPVVERMARLAERAGGIIRRVNDLACRRELSVQQLDLAALLQRVRANLAHSPGLKLGWSIPVPAAVIEADALLLEHLINNLVSNALDWAAVGSAPPQVWVALRLEPALGMAIVSVADSGPGVAENQRETIFKAFVSNKSGGMGMGLAICRSIVEAHHGRIEVARDPLLGGALFSAYLPLAKRELRATPKEPA